MRKAFKTNNLDYIRWDFTAKPNESNSHQGKLLLYKDTVHNVLILLIFLQKTQKKVIFMQKKRDFYANRGIDVYIEVGYVFKLERNLDENLKFRQKTCEP